MSGWLVYPLVFAFGAVVGSFLNVVIYRYNTSLGLRGRSHCLSCGHELAARDLIPLGSYLSTRGRCRFCGSWISLQYPLVELITGLLFISVVWRFPGELVWPVFWMFILALLLVITVYDIKHKIIPDRLVYLFIGISLLSPVIKGLSLGSVAAILIAVLNGLLAGGIFFFIFWSLWRVSAGRWMGFGDAKLVLGIGILLGLYQGLTALFIGFWLGAVVGLMLLAATKARLSIIRRYFTLKSEVPFAPFLVAGVFITLIGNLNVVSWF